MGAAGRAWMQRDFTVERQGAALVALYHRKRTGAGVEIVSPLVNAGIFLMSELVQLPGAGFAGAPIANDVLKCQLKPVSAADYKASFTPAQLARLKAIFPDGVCDFSNSR